MGTTHNIDLAQVAFLGVVGKHLSLVGGRMTVSKGLGALTCLAAVLVTSGAVAQAARPFGITNDDLFGTVIRASKWQNSNISVCWENPSTDDAPFRAISRSAVEETWQRYSNVTFLGWGKCADNAPGIRIRISDERPHTKALGRFLDTRPQGMVLNFTFATWSQACQKTREFCAYAIAAHEFGHALGFAHEQNRPDAPAECQKDGQGTTGDYNVTKYDPQSIMNYCNPVWNGDGKLSALDIEALQTFYAPPH